MRQTLKALGFLAALLPSLAMAQTQIPTMPAGTVLGRLGISSGPAQAIPFSNFFASSGFITLPVVSGNMACFSGTTGKLQDCGASPSGIGVTVGATVVTGGPGVLYNASSGGTLQAMTPVVNAVAVTNGSGAPSWAPTLPLTNLPSGVPGNTLNTQTANYTLATTDCGKTVQAGTGSTGFFTVTVPSVSGFSATCVITIVNGDTGRGKGIGGFAGCSTRQILWPAQSCMIGIVNGAWATLSRPGRWRTPNATALNFYSDFTNGTDTVGATDGLGTGTAAFKSAEYCFLLVADQIDYNASSQTLINCNMAANTADTQGVHAPVHALVGAQGGSAFQIVGASLAISGAVTNGGLCKITVPSTATYTLNQIVAVYGVSGATGCNGTWKVTVTDSTHLTLQGTTFGGAYTSGGTVTNGSSFTVTGSAFGCFFGTVIQLWNISFLGTSNGITGDWGCKIYLSGANIFGGSPAATHITMVHQAQLHVEGDIGIITSAGNSFIQAQSQGMFLSDVSASVNFLPGVNPSFAGLGFAYADTQAQASFQGLTINTNANTITGTRCNANMLGLIVSNTGVPNTYFPGNANCSTATGGVAN